jgi:hypothetical protein
LLDVVVVPAGSVVISFRGMWTQAQGGHAANVEVISMEMPRHTDVEFEEMEVILIVIQMITGARSATM